MPWDSLAAYVVRVHPSLKLAVRVATGSKYDCDVNAKVDTAGATVFVKESTVLARVDGGGRALGALFGAKRDLLRKRGESRATKPKTE